MLQLPNNDPTQIEKGTGAGDFLNVFFPILKEAKFGQSLRMLTNKKYTLLETNISISKGSFEDEFPFSQVGPGGIW